MSQVSVKRLNSLHNNPLLTLCSPAEVLAFMWDVMKRSGAHADDLEKSGLT